VTAAVLRFQPLTPRNWPDLVRLFGARGACGGCWCMYWRRSAPEYEAGKGDGNRRALRRLAAATPSPGILAYRGDRAVGWCAVAPREATPRLNRSRVLAAVDDTPVWSITCLYVERDSRGQGVSVALLEAAVAHARRQGARMVEGYPIDTRGQRQPAAFVWTGLAPAFRRAGFDEVARRSRTRPIMRPPCARARM
jgi:GNAT superfamily N-acetyltransferase